MSGGDNHGLSKPLEQYPQAKPEDLPTPPAVDPPAVDHPGTKAATTRPVPAAEVAVLEFIEPGKLTRTITLAHPFRLDSAEIRTITVRALSVAEVGRIAGEPSTDLDNYRFFAVMTGLPAPVLRAMPAEDGGRVLEACDPFMPRFMKATD